MRNGLNIASVSELVHEIRTIPAESPIRLESRVTPLGPQVSNVSIETLTGGTVRIARDFQFLSAPGSEDHAQALGVHEFILVALGGCVLVTFVQGASARGFGLIAARVEVEADFVVDGEGRPCVNNIQYKYVVDCDGPPAALVDIAHIVTCLSPNHRGFLDKGSISVNAKNGDQEQAVLIDAIPPMGTPVSTIRKKVVMTWHYGTQLKASARGLTALVDQPKQYLGLDSAPNPQEYLLSAAGLELARELQKEAHRRDMPLSQIEIHSGGSIDLLALTNVGGGTAPVRVHDIVQRVDWKDPKGPDDAMIRAAAFRCAIHEVICAQHDIDVEVATPSETLAKFRSDQTSLRGILDELERRKQEAAQRTQSA